MISKVLWLIYRRLRIGLEPFGFVLLYGAYTNNFNLTLLLAAFGFFCMDVFGVMYNDYYDYETDLRNKRRDKWISAGLVTKNQMLYLGLLFALVSLVLLYFTNIFVFLVGFYYFLVLIGYSHPKIPMRRNLVTYLILGTFYLPMFYALSILFQNQFTAIDIYYTLFVFFQAVYLIAHKDVNDTKDDRNIFLKNKYNRGLLICAVLGILSSVFLLPLSFTKISLLVLWLLNLVILKIWLLKRVYKRTVKKRFRDWIVLFEFLTPYFYALVFIFGGIL